jgi:hypothetical protein
MVVTPDAFAAVEYEGQNGMTGRSVGEQSPMFIQAPVRDAMNTKLVDTQVQSSDHRNVGTIKGIGLNESINPAAMSLSYNDSADSWNASVDATMLQIESTPEAQLQ